MDLEYLLSSDKFERFLKRGTKRTQGLLRKNL